MAIAFPAFNKKAVVNFAERAGTAAVIGAVVAYQAGARDYKVLFGAAVAALLSFTKNFVKQAVQPTTVVPAPKPAA